MPQALCILLNIPKPTDEQQMSIIHNMYVDATKNTNLFVERIEDSLMKKLRPYSLRAVKVIIEDAISNALLELDADALAEKLASGEKISLTASHLKDPQKKTSMGFTKS
jgi:hypothetical protein